MSRDYKKSHAPQRRGPGPHYIWSFIENMIYGPSAQKMFGFAKAKSKFIFEVEGLTWGKVGPRVYARICSAIEPDIGNRINNH